MYWLNNDEKKVVAEFFAEQFAGACVAEHDDDGEIRESCPYTLEKTSALASEIGNNLEGVAVEMTAFVRNVDDVLAQELGRVYVAWYPDNGPLAGTFFLSGMGDDPVSDCTIQVGQLAGGDESAGPLDVRELGEWVVEQIVFAIETGQFDGDVEYLFDCLRGKLSIL